MSDTTDTTNPTAAKDRGTTQRPQGVFIQALALGIAADWRRCPPEQRRRDLEAFLAADDRAAGERVTSEVYTSVGLEAGIDLILWRSAKTLDALEAAGALLLATDLGASCTVRHSLIGLTSPSQYAPKATAQESGLLTGERSRYLIVYPFTKTTDWYLQSREARQGVMNEHMRVGRTYPTVRQALAYSFGLDDQDFVVAYETDDLPAFGDLVRELRGTDSRRSTVRDTPLLLGIHRSKNEIVRLLAGDVASITGAER